MKLFIFFVVFFSSLWALENSTVLNIDDYENLDKLSKEKYTTSQYVKISTLLASKKEKIRVMSYNILFNIDEERQKEENKWPKRLPRIVG